jgi:uncharacterized protein
MALRVDRFEDAAAFLAAVGGFLDRREAEHNLLFGILDSLSRGMLPLDSGPYLASVVDADAVVGVALRTPPFNLLLSELDDPAATDAIATDLANAGETLPGVTGPVAIARDFAARWAARSGAEAGIRTRERIFRLTRVIPPRPAPGSMRLADHSDADLLVTWLTAFTTEALPDAPAGDAEATVDRWLRLGTKRNFLWELGSTPVAWTAIGGRTPHGTRVGPVYTPPEHRGRGYASALVAATSQMALDEGLEFCFLFTDLANPISNHIYQAIGYEPVSDVDEWFFR